MIATSEAHGESIQQKIRIAEVGELSCSGGADLFGPGIGNNGIVGSFIHGWAYLEEESFTKD